MVLILGDVRQMQEIAEGPNDREHRIARQIVENGFEFGARCRIEFAVRALAQMHRGLADVLDDGKNVVAFLIANGVAEQAAEQADVVSQREILVGSGHIGPVDGLVTDYGRPCSASAIGSATRKPSNWLR
jgi:hypothetical protein